MWQVKVMRHGTGNTPFLFSRCPAPGRRPPPTSPWPRKGSKPAQAFAPLQLPHPRHRSPRSTLPPAAHRPEPRRRTALPPLRANGANTHTRTGFLLSLSNMSAGVLSLSLSLSLSQTNVSAVRNATCILPLIVFERERENPRGPGERACGGEAMQPNGPTNPGASAMRHHREAAEQGLA